MVRSNKVVSRLLDAIADDLRSSKRWYTTVPRVHGHPSGLCHVGSSLQPLCDYPTQQG